MSSIRFLSFIGVSATLIALTSCGNTQTPSQVTSEANTSPTNTTQTTAEKPTATDENQDVDYMTTLGLMKGHLLVAQELLEQGKPDQAEPHIGHPVEELYAEVEKQLPERNVKEFKTPLTKLHDLVKSKPSASEVTTQYDAAVQGIDEAIAAIPADKRQSPEFVLNVINEMLDTAGEEYDAAIANGKIVEAIEYQDSRGFVIYADTLYQTIADQVSQENPEAHQAIESSLTDLKQAWPSVNPPDNPVKTPDEVSKLIKTIEENSQKIST
ncbi:MULTISPECIES: hypothetical protein [unclassified Coleofasciculus]|uniref:hypothetical protein n=1 Tax=unclassified Coleofasciculus TaxID=2692782 RepID=UPI0018824F0F|nr:MULTISPECIES: hypothetical protein [unclassified Coleofasciculus]MBE9127679.1 hypothetical protein [Coleofasciculus sp. LEGE 07081]MBE9151017.1 hypothetical protein [Coleofasciculus sp. LEGE 07092]